ncbi:MAG: glycosyltransferase family 2 protein [Cyanobacteria bacterium CRU_2_1]|nr:glycosyltransferase family 2 protein [Cyanobacteria bacterium RU_5_0]NJR59046.1 glycosyltransferase family 2 protein [Cyanobacteria bacterium CRU_2_1]
MNIDFTVAIPVYNGADRLPLVLERLRSQVNTERISWEIIVVDNNSTDTTAQVVQSFQTNWHPHIPLKYCFEPKQGLAHARQKAIEEAIGTFVGFLDDDNLAAPDWVNAAYEFGQMHPNAGAYGGQTEGDFEVSPPKEIEKVKALLAIKKYADQPKLYEPEKLRLPAGAGLVVRRQAWLKCIPPCLSRITRGGNDYEISVRLHRQGWEIWYNPSMQIQHRIPAHRMERSYLISLARLYGLCTCEIRLAAAKPWEKPIILIKTFSGSLRRLILHLINHHNHSKTDLGAACEMAFLLGMTISPFVYLYKQVSDQKGRSRAT